jgi:hypothetical protein
MGPSRSTVGRRSLAVLCAASLGAAGLGVGCAATPEPELQPQPPMAPPAVVPEEVPAAEDEAAVEPAATAEEVVAPVSPEPEPVAEAMTVDDEVIATKILLKFAADARLSLYAIDVRSTNGRVVLAGSVGSQQAREAAEALARQTEGVRSVENRPSTN